MQAGDHVTFGGSVSAVSGSNATVALSGGVAVSVSLPTAACRVAGGGNVEVGSDVVCSGVLIGPSYGALGAGFHVAADTAMGGETPVIVIPTAALTKTTHGDIFAMERL